MTDPGELRVSDAEREAVVERLREASVEGRLTLAELTERTEAAYLAVTYRELAQVTADLPGPGARPAPVQGSSGEEKKKRRWFVAVMGDTRRRGKWRVDKEIGAAAVMGDVTIDLREAEVRGDEIEITAVSVMGDVKIIVPDGVDVDLDGVAFMGDKRVDVLEAPTGRHVPKVRVHAYAVMGDVKIIGDSRADPIRRAWFDWSEWWLERRARITGHGHDHLKHSLGIDHKQLRELGHYAKHELGRYAKEQLRELKRELKHGNLPKPPPPPPPPPQPPRHW